MKKILFLGASRIQLPPIQYAVENGYYVITCDYLPDNPGHQLANEYHNISTRDKDAVLRMARKAGIDGVVAYAADSAAPTVAYVAEKLGLPGNPYESVTILTRKDLFRNFLKANGFNAPRSNSFDSLEEAEEWLRIIGAPAYVKPVDSSASIGNTLLTSASDLPAAFEHAMKHSSARRVVVEEVIEKAGYQIDSDVFMEKGELKYWLWANAHFDYKCSPPIEIANSYPATLKKEVGEKAKSELEKIFRLLNCRTGAFNVEFLVDSNEEIWFLEVAPRNGGSRIPELIKYATNNDMVKAIVDTAVGLDSQLVHVDSPIGYWSNYTIHSLEDGVLKDIWMSNRLKSKIVEKQIWSQPGDFVRKSRGGIDDLGEMILRFDDASEMVSMLDDMNKDIKVNVDI
ncbi:ATP-grasp domain-containing protein [Modicisalibacter xianhensis]|uniref:Biotin carboxylase n=1 Tax=Modicisalibacter xianhensis TaxID=442341 RepID=A0A1I2ZEP8_9GAMM|nr:ATP-grasp domain-containing protein [Halomonas xianhensis]SFH36317.1 Biotin carboxylase [Halomonas xianhensis]